MYIICYRYVASTHDSASTYDIANTYNIESTFKTLQPQKSLFKGYPPRPLTEGFFLSKREQKYFVIFLAQNAIVHLKKNTVLRPIFSRFVKSGALGAKSKYVRLVEV